MIVDLKKWRNLLKIQIKIWMMINDNFIYQLSKDLLRINIKQVLNYSQYRSYNISCKIILKMKLNTFIRYQLID